ncbi:ciliary neurotrophic factor-like isoform X1 [Megalops cyprinoides]|uniref:ciliary neurotrophic factor-like isoform X1 n=1 Tax=Megalops cyprinoides TaxID=118141 RepID=UPI001864C308|nr:ciliary neurotrophic factor-like isoform X1 [Megalops cyprinoides]XP_036407847.1 ciliary neurotrophic factor-like isoform X1 [Megalops cyprinoides]
MAGEEQSGRPGSGRSRTERAVALARLLHRDCTRLLELYKEKESFPAEHSLEADRIVSVCVSAPHLTTDERVWLLHSALQQCLRLLEYVIGREEELEEEGEYESVRNSVRDRLGHLLHNTSALLVKEEGSSEPSCDPDSTEEMQVDEADGSFGVKLWTYRVLQELIHWTHSASETLHTLHTEREAEQEKGHSENGGAEV